MGVNSLPKTVTRQRRGCDLNPGSSAPESNTPDSNTLTTRLPSQRVYDCARVDVCCTESRGARQDQRRLIRQLHDAVSRDDVTAVRQLTTPTSASGTDARA